MSYFLPFVLTFLLSIILTGWARFLGKKFKILAIPRARDVHKEPLPRIGGLAMAASFILAVFLVFRFVYPDLSFGAARFADFDTHFWGIILGASLISLAMFMDDLRNLRPTVKLTIQILVALVVVASGIGIDKITNPFGADINLNAIYIPIATISGVTYHFSLFSDLLTLVWIVGMMNVLNFIDGVDGLASGQSAIAALTLFLLCLSASVNQPATAMISIILAGASLGFLVWNFPPAKIFMGDSGSMFLGFMLGVIPLISGGKMATAFLVLGFPIVDGLVVAAGRLMRRQNLTTPDKTHLHHRFLAAGFSPRQAILSMYLIAAAFGWVALRSTTVNKIIAAGILVVLLLVLIWILKIVKDRRQLSN